MTKQTWLKPIYGLVGFTTTAMPVLAQTGNPIGVDTDIQPASSKGADLKATIVTFINYFLLILGLVAVGFIIYAGVKMLTSQGNETKVKEGTKMITYAIIGLLVIFLAYAIVAWVANVTPNTNPTPTGTGV
jgi:cytochrome bd-type quinol oxidase subunit 2